MIVPINDRTDELEFIRLALNMAEIYVDYQQSDLINRVLKGLEKRKQNFNLKDICHIKHQWEKDWQEYFKKKSEELSKNVSSGD